MEVAVKKLFGVFYLYFLAFIAQSGGVLMAHRVITNLVSLCLRISPIIQSRELRDCNKERRPQMALVQFRDRYIQMHCPGVVKGERHRGGVTIPGQHLESLCLRDSVAKEQSAHYTCMDQLWHLSLGGTSCV